MSRPRQYSTLCAAASRFCASTSTSLSCSLCISHVAAHTSFHLQNMTSYLRKAEIHSPQSSAVVPYATTSKKSKAHECHKHEQGLVGMAFRCRQHDYQGMRVHKLTWAAQTSTSPPLSSCRGTSCRAAGYCMKAVAAACPTRRAAQKALAGEPCNVISIQKCNWIRQSE
jgi:hypothetical protein